MAVIAFRLDGGAAIGSGHLVRCGALGEALQDLGHQVIFLCRNPLPKVPPFPIRYFAPPLPAPPPGQYGVQDISDELPALQRTLEEDRIDCLIVDHYGAVEDYLSALQGHIRLVMGNHDTRSTQWYRDCGFEEVYDCPILFESFWLLSHEPLYLNSNMPYGNLFGHVHGNPAYADASSQSCCVCVERTDYRPISFEEVKRRMGLIL